MYRKHYSMPHNHTQLSTFKMSLENCLVKGGACIIGILGSVSERLECFVVVAFTIHVQPKFRSHSHRNC